MRPPPRSPGAAGVRARISRGLLECDFGSWTGRKLADLMKLPEWRTVQTAPSVFRFPDGESFTEMQQRIVGEIASSSPRHPGERIVCVSHADPIKAAVAHYAGTHLDLFQRTVISPCSVTPLLLGSGAARRPCRQLVWRRPLVARSIVSPRVDGGG